MRLEEDGLAFLAPRCGSWMYLDVSNTKRGKKNQFWGDTNNRSVQSSNNMVMGCIVLIQLAEARKLCLAFENPVKSYMWHWPPLRDALKELGYGFVAVLRCAWEAKQKGKMKLWKKYRIAGQGEWIQALAKPCPCGDQGHLRTTKVYRDAAGKKRCQGIKSRLMSSANYPPLLGKAIVQAWLSRRSASGSTVMPKKAKKEKKAMKVMKVKKAVKAMKVKKAVKAMKAMKAKKGAQTHAKKAKMQEKEQKEQKEQKKQMASWMTPLLQDASKRSRSHASSASSSPSWLNPACEATNQGESASPDGMDAAIHFLEGKLLIAIGQNELVSLITWSVLASQPTSVWNSRQCFPFQTRCFSERAACIFGAQFKRSMVL